ncbi:MAG: hypothetical protein WD042_05720 [Phycisphaeraceae bacterium]
MKRHAVHLVWGITILFLLPGCSSWWKGLASMVKDDPEPRVWQIKPQAVRVFPTTRVAQEVGTAVLEARIEIFDQAGDSTKAVGNFRFELLSDGRLNDPTMGPRLYLWEEQMLTLEQNREHWDPITRTYYFRLKLDEAPSGDQALRLVVTFIPVGEDRLEGQALISPEASELR